MRAVFLRFGFLTTKTAKAVSVDAEVTAVLLDLDRVIHIKRKTKDETEAMTPQFHNLNVLTCVFWKLEQAM